MDQSDLARLMARIEIGAPDECWKWRGLRGSMLPQIQVDGKNYRAPRLLLEWRLQRPLRPRCRVAHSCENTLCCNPAHIIEYCPEEALAYRLWRGVLVGEPDDCWMWWGEPYGDCYGRIDFRNKNYSTHRVAWMVTNGPIPDGMWVLHRCDNMKCCNPAHLFLGTCQDNSDDKVRKGRQAKGLAQGMHTHPEKRRRGRENNKALVDEAQVLSIRERYAAGGVTMKNLGSEYAISEPTVRQIVTGFTWTHVGGPLAPVEAPRGPLTPEETVEIRRAYAAQEKGVQALMQEYGIGFPRLKEVIADLPVWRPRQPPPPPMGGEQHPMAKLTWEKVREMRRLWAEKVPQQEIADRFGISLGQAHNILRGRSWKEPSNAA